MKKFLSALVLALLIAAPASAQVVLGGTSKIMPDFVQLVTVNTAAPAASDCDVAAETGRLYIDSTNDVYYFCSGASGWVSLSGGATTLTWPVVAPNGGAIQTGLVAGNTVLFQGYESSGAPGYVTTAKITASATAVKWQFLTAPRFGAHAIFGQDGGSTIYSQNLAEVAYAPLNLDASTIDLKVSNVSKVAINADGITSAYFANNGAVRTLTTAADAVLFQGYDTSGTPQYRTVATLAAAAGVPTWTFNVAPRFGLAATYDSIIVSPVAKGANQFDGTITSADLTGARTWTLPDASLTLAAPVDGYLVASSATGYKTVRDVWTNYYGAARCQGASATSLFNLVNGVTAASANCIAGTNIQRAGLDYTDASNHTAQMPIHLTDDIDLTGAVTLDVYWATAATSGDVKWNVFTACVGADEDPDPAFNAAQTITQAALANANRKQEGVIAALTTTGCVLNDTMFVKIERNGQTAGDTIAATATLIAVEISYFRKW